MRTLWNILSFLAVVNLLALLIALAWLWQSGRLNRARVQDVRQMLSTSVREAKAGAAKLATEAEAERLRQQEERVRQHPSADSATQIRQVALVHEQQEQARRRLEDERRMLAEQLEQATAQMEGHADALQKQRTSWHKDMADDTQRKSDEQFLQAVKQLEQISPKQAKKVLETLMSGNNVAESAGMTQAVAYLDAMTPRAAAKVLREFKTDGDIALATELLERLRTHGVEALSRNGAAPLGRPSTTSASSTNRELPHAGSAPHPDDAAGAQ